VLYANILPPAPHHSGAANQLGAARKRRKVRMGSGNALVPNDGAPAHPERVAVGRLGAGGQAAPRWLARPTSGKCV